MAAIGSIKDCYKSYNRIQNREKQNNTYNLYDCYTSWHYYPVTTKNAPSNEMDPS